MSDSGGITAKARCISGKLLKPQDYAALLTKTDISSVVTYLKDTDRFHDCFAEVNERFMHRGQVETLIGKDVYSIYRRLWKFSAQKDGLYAFFLKKMEIRQLLNIIYYVESGSYESFVAAMPTYLVGETSFDLAELANARSFSDILSVISDTAYYKALKPILPSNSTEKVDFNECSLALQLTYFRWIFKEVKESCAKEAQVEMKKVILGEAELENILISYRMRAFFGLDTEQIREVLVPYHYRVSVAQIEEILDDSDAVYRLQKTLKQKYFKDKVDYDAANPEVGIRRYNNSFFSKQLRMTQSGTMAFYSLMRLLEIEQSNLTTITEGIRYSLPPSEIEKLLII